MSSSAVAIAVSLPPPSMYLLSPPHSQSASKYWRGQRWRRGSQYCSNHYYGDVNSIYVGSGTNIQDNSLVHVAKTNISGNVLPTIIVDNVTIGFGVPKAGGGLKKKKQGCP